MTYILAGILTMMIMLLLGLVTLAAVTWISALFLPRLKIPHWASGLGIILLRAIQISLLLAVAYGVGKGVLG